VFLLLEGSTVLTVGGGQVAARKIESLAQAGAYVKVVAKEVDAEIMEFEKQGICSVETRGYRHGEAASYPLTIAATDDMETNRAVAADAVAANRLVNVVDQPDLCNFIVPSIIRRGALTVAISTGGAAPSFSKRLRERAEKIFPESLGGLIEVLAEFRAHIIKTVPDIGERKRIMTEVANSPETDAFLEGDDKPLKELLSKWT